MNIRTTRDGARPRMRLKTALMAVAAAASMNGCATFSADGGLNTVATATRADIGQELRWARTGAERTKIDAEVSALLSRELTEEDAVQVALLNNRSIQAAFERMGISEADLVQSGRLPNPGFTLRHAGGAGRIDIEQSVTLNVLSLLTAPYVHGIAKRRFAAVQEEVLITIIQLADETRRAFLTAVASRESVQYLRRVKMAADTGRELARRMVAAGNWNRLDLSREQGFYTDAAQSLARAEMADTAARERLIRLLGLAGEPPALQLAGTLPELPPDIEPMPDMDQTILQARIDLRLMRMQVDELARRLDLTRATRFVNVLEAGPTRVAQGDHSAPYEWGYELSLQVPIFDGGSARVKRAEATYAEAVDRFTQAAIEARSQIRRAYAAYRSAYEIAKRQRDEGLANARLIAQQDLLRYHASLISVFDLLSDAREQIAGVDRYIQYTRDFWMAKSDLDTSLLGNAAP